MGDAEVRRPNVAGYEIMQKPGNAQLKAGRVLAMLEQEQLAREAGITGTTLRKLEQAGHGPVPGYAETLQKVLAALAAHGVNMYGWRRRADPAAAAHIVAGPVVAIPNI